MSGTRLAWIGARVAMAALLGLAIGAAGVRVFDFRALADYGEGTLLPMLQRLQHQPMSGVWLDASPYTLTSYGPGYYWVTLGATRLLPWQNSLIPGRLVSLAATLATAALVAVAVTRASRSGEMGAAAAALYLASPLVQAWGIVHRVDALATLPAVLAYVVLARPRVGLAAASVSVVLGSVVKQSVALTTWPLALALVFQRRGRAALVLIVVTGVLGLGVWWGLNRASGGYLLRMAVEGNVGRLFVRQGFWAGLDFLASPLGLAAMLLVGYRLVESPAKVCGSVYAIGFVAAAALAAVLSAKEGAAPLYFLEASALAAIVVGCEGLAAIWSVHRGRAMALVLVLVAVSLAPQVRYLRGRGLNLSTEPYCGRLIAESLGPGRGRLILADGQHVAAVMQAGWTPLLNDSFRLRLQIESGRMRPDAIVRAIDAGQVEFLVLKRPIEEHRQQVGSVSQKWSPEILAAMQRQFALATAWPEQFVFVYRLKRASGGG